jgi:hypothetical protein
VSARTIALMVPTTSRGRRRRGVEQTDLLRVLVPSLLASATWDGSVAYRLYVGYDAGDPFFDAAARLDELRAAIGRRTGDRPFALALERCEPTDHAPVAVWNHLFAAAYRDGCDFFYQLGDDIELETPGWARDFPAALGLDPDEAGLGVTGPVDRGCYDGHLGLRTDVLTQSFVSRLHMEIFGTYYPPVFRNWYSDDWITRVYAPDHLRPAFHQTIFNTSAIRPRYRIDEGARDLLDPAVARGRARLARWRAARPRRPPAGRLAVLAFSLWGRAPRYLAGALRNAELARALYPGWVCRFYVGASVPAATVMALAARPNVEVVVMDEPGDWRGLFWRFLAAADERVDVALFRDTDSRLGARERAAVDAWLASDRAVHIMRDHPWHATDILGGMWGVRAGALWDIRTLIARHEPESRWQADQDFLRARVFPRVRDQALVHDEFFDRRPFPVPRHGAEFVGQPFDEHDRPLDPAHARALTDALARPG